MSMWSRGDRKERVSTIDGPIIPSRAGAPGSGAVGVNEETAMRHSAVWACLRLRADLALKIHEVMAMINADE